MLFRAAVLFLAAYLGFADYPWWPAALVGAGAGLIIWCQRFWHGHKLTLSVRRVINVYIPTALARMAAWAGLALVVYIVF